MIFVMLDTLTPLDVCEFKTETLITILERLRCLRSYVNLHPSEGQHEFLDRIQPRFGYTLETLIIGQISTNYRDFYEDVSILSGFRTLRTLNLELFDLQAKSAREEDSLAELSRAVSSGDSREEIFAWIDFDAVLPPLAETIKFQYSHRYGRLGFSAQLAQSFLEQLDSFVRKRGRNRSDGYLKMVSIDFTETNEGGEKGLLEEMLKDKRNAWSKAGVAVVTDANDIEHETLETAPDIPDYDIEDEDDDDD